MVVRTLVQLCFYFGNNSEEVGIKSIKFRNWFLSNETLLFVGDSEDVVQVISFAQLLVI